MLCRRLLWFYCRLLLWKTNELSMNGNCSNTIENLVSVFTVICDVVLVVLVTTFIVDGDGVVALVVDAVVIGDDSFVDAFNNSVLLERDVVRVELDCVVSVVVVGVAVVAVVFGNNESMTPIGPDKSTSSFGHVSSSD